MPVGSVLQRAHEGRILLVSDHSENMTLTSGLLAAIVITRSDETNFATTYRVCDVEVGATVRGGLGTETCFSLFADFANRALPSETNRSAGR